MGTKSQKRAQKMTPEQLKTSRRELGLNQADMAKQLRTSRSGYVKWERGERPIPGVCEVAVELLVKKDRWVMQAITATLAKDFPGTGTR
jgi:DNA-binding transcriptional regulator YiaG